MRSGIRTDKRPERVILRAELRPESSGLKHERLDLRFVRSDLWTERADSRPERPNLSL